MPRPVPIDFRAVFDDVSGVVESARSATSGWRTLCVRERRRLGPKLSDELSALDLDADVPRIRAIVNDAAHDASDVDALLFGLFDPIDDGVGAYAGYHVAGIAARGRPASEVMHDPWTPERRFLRSHTLDALVAIARRCHLETRILVECPISFAAAALIGRFAAEDLERRVFVAFDEDRARPLPAGMPRFAEMRIAVRATAPSATSFTDAVPRLLQAC